MNNISICVCSLLFKPVLQHSESGNSPNSTHVNVEHDEEEPSSSSYLDFAVCLAFMKKVLPFAILLSLRWAWERRIGDSSLFKSVLLFKEQPHAQIQMAIL